MADSMGVRAGLPILAGAAAMLGLGLGVRQSFGILMLPMTRDIAITVSDFTLAMAVQNLGWGLLQPCAGALAARIGFRPIMLAGAVFYVAGLTVLMRAGGLFDVILGAGALVGMALACTASGMALAVGARTAGAEVRSLVLGAITAAGSLGALVSAPIAQALIGAFGWRSGALGLLALALGMLPAAWVAGGVDKIPASPGGGASVSAALGAAARCGPFLVIGGGLLRLPHAAAVCRHAFAVLPGDLRCSAPRPLP
jgi:MFS family permease